jgi:aspartate/methionine/tyrosine aminotransferase
VASSLDIERLLASRVRDIETSGIRRVWSMAQTCKDPVNLSIGQPDFQVPNELKQAAVDAILKDQNGYTQTKGLDALLAVIHHRMHDSFGWTFGENGSHDAMVTSGTAGALTLACLSVLDQGDELIIPDPYFVIYPTLARIAGATAVLCDTYPDFKMTADRVEPLITSKTKAVLLNSPANPTGVVLTQEEVDGVASLCRDRGILLITDEIYDEFVFPPAKHASPASSSEDVLVIRGYGKTYGCTGWRMGYAAGPARLIDEMAKLQQQTFVCAPSVMQHAMIGAYDIDLAPLIETFTTRRDMVTEILGDVMELVVPEGAFYAFPKVPESMSMTGTQFFERAIEHDVLLIQGDVFSKHDTHIRLSFAIANDKLERGLLAIRNIIQS